MEMKRLLKNWSGLVVVAVVLTCFFTFVASSLAEETYFPECFSPASEDTPVIKIKPRKGPYKMAFVNGFSGNAWRIQAIQATKAWAARPENKKWVKELKVVSVGNDVAAQIAAIDNFIAAGFDLITFIAVNNSVDDRQFRPNPLCHTATHNMDIVEALFGE